MVSGQKQPIYGSTPNCPTANIWFWTNQPIELGHLAPTEASQEKTSLYETSDSASAVVALASPVLRVDLDHRHHTLPQYEEISCTVNDEA
jgi:hypothetical protein